MTDPLMKRKRVMVPHASTQGHSSRQDWASPAGQWHWLPPASSSWAASMATFREVHVYSAAPAIVCHSMRPPMADQTRLAASASTVPPLIGRDREQATLRDALSAALAGRGALVLIGGDTGIGKTALAEWTLAEAAERGMLGLVGR